MTNKFEGVAGERNQVEVLLQNVAVNGDEKIARFILKNSEFTIIQKNKKIIAQGSNDADVFFLLSGEVKISPKNYTSFSRLAPYTVGETAALDPKSKRNADVIAATENVCVLQMAILQFQNLLSKFPEFEVRLRQDIFDRSQERMKRQSVNVNNDNTDSSYLKKHGWNIGAIGVAITVFIVAFYTSRKISEISQYSFPIASATAILTFYLFFWGQPKLVYRKLVKLWGAIGALRFIFDIGFAGYLESKYINIQIFPEDENKTVLYVFYFAVLVVLIVSDLYTSRENPAP